MSIGKSAAEPLWLQGRDAVVENDEGVKWRHGRPDYHLTRITVGKERTRHFPEKSLEMVVEDLVRVFEMEVSHKADPSQWVSVVLDKFRNRTNGGPWHTGQDIAARGSYNLFLGDTPYYKASEETFDSSHEVFHTAFPDGFFWEVLEVYSPPPVVSFKWRHWGNFTGPYKGQQPTGKRVEIFGMSVARVAEDLRLVEVEHYYDNSLFLSQIATGCPVHAAGTK
ncbi:ester cyclase [Archangium violaceum]|uniref:ester cyclase n=1 Tax=Archangium violaceum TaxID=83451 RepID=UPI002B318774|nr:ester cyclase [Archangium violaceum]